MIVWLASYPKSGNTWMWLFIKSYFNPPKKKFSLNYHKDDPIMLEPFPDERMFDKLKINYENFFDLSKNWVNLQSLINLNNKTNYLKTHNAMCTINNHKFTNMLNKETYEAGEFKKKIYNKTLLGSWSDHYNSWKNYKSREIIIIKYEDMVNSASSTFLKVLNYLSKIIKIDVDHTKMDKAIEETSFKNLKSLEINEGFKTNLSKNKFFRKGVVGDWREKLNKEQVEKIEKAFESEMIELGYL